MTDEKTKLEIQAMMPEMIRKAIEEMKAESAKDPLLDEDDSMIVQVVLDQVLEAIDKVVHLADFLTSDAGDHIVRSLEGKSAKEIEEMGEALGRLVAGAKEDS